jgi:hypothetical protein
MPAPRTRKKARRTLCPRVTPGTVSDGLSRVASIQQIVQSGPAPLPPPAGSRQTRIADDHGIPRIGEAIGIFRNRMRVEIGASPIARLLSGTFGRRGPLSRPNMVPRVARLPRLQKSESLGLYNFCVLTACNVTSCNICRNLHFARKTDNTPGSSIMPKLGGFHAERAASVEG